MVRKQKKEAGMIKYTLPDFTVGLGLNLFFIRLLETNPDYFAEGVHIDSVYGCFPGCIANGGRAFVRDRYSHAQMEETFGLLAEHGVTARLTLTNMLLEEHHLEDAYLNEMLELARAFEAEVIVYADVLDAYVRNQYGLRRVLSTTRALETPDEVNRATERYDYVVLNYNHHKDAEFLAALRDKSKVEVMVNEFCQRNCPHREEHYLHNSRDQMDATLNPFTCIASKGEFFDHPSGHPVLFTDEEVRGLHDECGIEYFKIVGRGVPFETTLESLTYYLLKPAYREGVKRQIRALVRR